LESLEVADASYKIHLQLRQDMVYFSDGEEDVDSDDDLQKLPPPKKSKMNYDTTRWFQNEWVAKLVWMEPI